MVISALDEHLELVVAVREMTLDITRAALLIKDALIKGKKIMICGNGGSAADSQHIAAELVGRFLKNRAPLPALALNVNTSILSAIGNDFGFEEVYARQVQAHGCEGDILLAISTSGTSVNIIRAASIASDNGIKVIGLTGKGGGKLKEICNLCLCVPSDYTPRIQEIHILIGHIISQLVEEDIC
ncbi:MAG: SIS domain-containing protein [Firmicutes bacterium]|nr:SIS domain-containing protein [Bacillota bacterium]